MNRAEQATLKALTTMPTAAGREDAVIAWIGDWAARRSLPVDADEAGNLFIRLRRGRVKSRPHWLFSAHMDHPGFVSVSQRGRTVTAEFRGGVGEGYFLGSRVRFYAGGGFRRATVRRLAGVDERDSRICRLELDAPAEVPAGSIGMWDVTPWRLRGTRLSARACDDLAGCAAVLCALDRLRRRKGPLNVTALLTRAEEKGFIGALAACEAGSIPPDALVVAIETSREQPGARLGEGVVIRVGDRTSLFHPDLTRAVSVAAGELGKRDRTFRHVRRLMPGGTCESTVFCAWGHVAAGLCLPLGNYHNMGDDGTIRPERIDTRDFDALVKLLAALPDGASDPADVAADLRGRLEKHFQRHRSLLG